MASLPVQSTATWHSRSVKYPLTGFDTVYHTTSTAHLVKTWNHICRSLLMRRLSGGPSHAPTSHRDAVSESCVASYQELQIFERDCEWTRSESQCQRPSVACYRFPHLELVACCLFERSLDSPNYCTSPALVAD